MSSLNDGTKVKEKARPIAKGHDETKAWHYDDVSTDTIRKEAKQKLANDPHAKLMNRNTSGKNHDLDKKEMKKLTNKNYEMLPEVRRKLEEERKNEEWK